MDSQNIKHPLAEIHQYNQKTVAPPTCHESPQARRTPNLQLSHRATLTHDQNEGWGGGVVITGLI